MSLHHTPLYLCRTQPGDHPQWASICQWPLLELWVVIWKKKGKKQGSVLSKPPDCSSRSSFPFFHGPDLRARPVSYTQSDREAPNQVTSLRSLDSASGVMLLICNSFFNLPIHLNFNPRYDSFRLECAWMLKKLNPVTGDRPKHRLRTRNLPSPYLH